MPSEQMVKNLVRLKSQEFGIPVEQVYSLYGLEQLMKKLSHSPLKENLVLKGGFLLMTRYGLASRATKDLDTTVREMALTEGKMNEIVDYLTSPNEMGQQEFSLISKRSTRADFDFPGYSLKLYFHLGKMKMKLDLDITAGEDLLPINKLEKIHLMFEEGIVEFPTYPIEQILADKIYATAAYGAIDDTNTRSKDLYDIYFLTKVHNDIDYSKVFQAVKRTKRQRDNATSVLAYPMIIDNLSHSVRQQEFWKRYADNNSFAENLEFETVMKSVRQLAKVLKSKEPSKLNHEKKHHINKGRSTR